MKRILLAVLTASVAVGAHAQTKGTNTVGVGISTTNRKYENTSGVRADSKSGTFSLSYGRFIKDNLRLGFTASCDHSLSKQPNLATEINGYGGNVNLQKYHKLFNKFYAFFGGNAAYRNGEKEETEGASTHVLKSNYYSIGVQGGLTYFVSKRWALETNLLGASFAYGKDDESLGQEKQTSTYFNLSTSGAINNLGFNIYFLF